MVSQFFCSICKLTKLGQECKAVLVLNNCSAHPDQTELVSDDGKIIAKFLPPNVTSLIQPMDQGVIEAVKRNYKKKLLRGAIIADDQGESTLDFLKSVNMSKVVQYGSEAWSEVKATTLRKSWEKIIPIAAQPLVRPSIDVTLASALAWKGMDEGAFQSLAQVKYDPAEDETPPVKMRKSCKNPSFYSGGIRSRFTCDFMSGPAPQTFIQFQEMFQA